MENKAKPSAPTNSGSKSPEVSQDALAGPVGGAGFLVPANNLQGRPFRVTETETRTRQVEMVFLDPLSDSPVEGLSDLAQQVRPELAGILRSAEDQATGEDPPKIVSRATGVLAGLTRLLAALFELLKGFRRLLGL
jgi:hypothetical protein